MRHVACVASLTFTLSFFLTFSFVAEKHQPTHHLPLLQPNIELFSRHAWEEKLSHVSSQAFPFTERQMLTLLLSMAIRLDHNLFIQLGTVMRISRSKPPIAPV